MEVIVISDSGAYVSRALFPGVVAQAIKINGMQYAMYIALGILFIFTFASLFNSILSLYHIRHKKTVWYNKIYPSFFATNLLHYKKCKDKFFVTVFRNCKLRNCSEIICINYF